MHHGMLTIYKEAGYTSSDAVARLRGILRMRKIGHTGTLDPDAEGVLPMCLGNATRICELIADREKEYLAVMRLGVKTDTQDMSGTILSQMEESRILQCLCAPEKEAAATDEQTSVSDAETPARDAQKAAEERIRRAAAAFVGEIDQIPPMYSAIKVNGKRLYDMARKGITVERRPRRITIYSITVEEIDLPLVTMRVCCSKGTYIRTLCEDIGNVLGTGAAMQSLLRTRVGRFTLEEALTLDEVERIAKTQPEKLPALIRPVDSFFEDLPAGVCSPDAIKLLKNGNALTRDQIVFPDDPGDSANKKTADSVRREDEGKTIGYGIGDIGAASGSFPGLDSGDKVIRVYDGNGCFYGLYIKKERQNRYTAYKMFLPEQQG